MLQIAVTDLDTISLQVYLTSFVRKRCQRLHSALCSAGGVSKPRAGDSPSGSCTGSGCPPGRPCASGGSSTAVASCRTCAAAGSASATTPTASSGPGSHCAHCAPHAGQRVCPACSPSAAAAAAPATAGTGSAAAAAGGAATACTGAACTAGAPSSRAELCFSAIQQCDAVQCRGPAIPGGYLGHFRVHSFNAVQSVSGAHA